MLATEMHRSRPMTAFDSSYMMIRPQGALSCGTKVMSGLQLVDGVLSFDSRIARQVDEVAQRFLAIDASVVLSAQSAVNQVSKLIACLRTSNDIPSYLLDDFSASYKNGAAWLNRNVSELNRISMSRAWDEIYVLCNLISEVNTLMLNARFCRVCQYSLLFVEGPARSGLAALATLEVPGTGAIASAAKVPYVRNLWSGVPGNGTELLRWMRDSSGSESMLVKPLSPAVGEYYRRYHCGEPCSQAATLLQTS